MDHHHVVHLVRTVIGILGNIISLGLFLSPTPTIKRIITNKSVEEFHPYIYIAGILNCCLWVLYGSPAVHPDSTLVWTINSAGLVLYAAYLSIFVWYAPTKKKLQVFAGIAVVAAVMAAVSVSMLLLVHVPAKRSMIVGIICAVFNVGLYAAPLTIVKKVVETKSVEFLPFWVCLAGMANGIVWTTYSLLPFDINILVGNGLGAILGLFQMGLHWRYGSSRKEQPIDDQADQKASELQLENIVISA